MVQGIIAGGYNAIFKAQEGAEDSLTLAQEDLQAKIYPPKTVLSVLQPAVELLM